jgi:hypothetical protein
MKTLMAKPSILNGLILAGVFAVCPAVLAQDNTGDNMDVVESEDAGEEAVGSKITLPESAAPEAHENAAYGLETANEAREGRREFGEDRAAGARERREHRDRGDATRDIPERGGAPNDRPDGR